MTVRVLLREELSPDRAATKQSYACTGLRPPPSLPSESSAARRPGPFGRRPPANGWNPIHIASSNVARHTRICPATLPLHRKPVAPSFLFFSRTNNQPAHHHLLASVARPNLLPITNTNHNKRHHPSLAVDLEASLRNGATAGLPSSAPLRHNTYSTSNNATNPCATPCRASAHASRSSTRSC